MDLSDAVDVAPDADEGFVVAGKRQAGRIDAKMGGDDSRDLRADGGDGGAALGMDGVSQKNDVGLGGGVDPK